MIEHEGHTLSGVTMDWQQLILNFYCISVNFPEVDILSTLANRVKLMPCSDVQSYLKAARANYAY